MGANFQIESRTLPKAENDSITHTRELTRISTSNQCENCEMRTTKCTYEN